MAAEFLDADDVASRLAPGSVNELHTDLTLAVAQFYARNGDMERLSAREAMVMYSVVATHVLDLLLNVAGRVAPLQPGGFQAYIGAVAGDIERGRHLRGRPS